MLKSSVEGSVNQKVIPVIVDATLPMALGELVQEDIDMSKPLIHLGQSYYILNHMRASEVYGAVQQLPNPGFLCLSNQTPISIMKKAIMAIPEFAALYLNTNNALLATWVAHHGLPLKTSLLIGRSVSASTAIAFTKDLTMSAVAFESSENIDVAEKVVQELNETVWFHLRHDTSAPFAARVSAALSIETCLSFDPKLPIGTIRLIASNLKAGGKLVLTRELGDITIRAILNSIHAGIMLILNDMSDPQRELVGRYASKKGFTIVEGGSTEQASDLNAAASAIKCKVEQQLVHLVASSSSMSTIGSSNVKNKNGFFPSVVSGSTLNTANSSTNANRNNSSSNNH